MKRVFKTSVMTKAGAILSIPLALFWIGLFLMVCIDPFYENNRLSTVLIIGVFMLAFLLLSVICFAMRNDSVILTDKYLKLHLHRQSFPFSLKASDDEIRRKDIRSASIRGEQQKAVLVVTLNSGEVKEYGIEHMEIRLRAAIETHFSPETKGINKTKEINLVEVEGLDESIMDEPGPLALSKRKSLLWFATCSLVAIIGTALMGLEKIPLLGFFLTLYGFLFGSLVLFRYYSTNALILDSKVKKKGRKVTVLLGLLLLCIFIAGLYFTLRFYFMGSR